MATSVSDLYPDLTWGREVSVTETTLRGSRPKNGLDRLTISEPGIHTICEPLYGSSIIDKNGERQVRYLPIEHAERIYAKAMLAYERFHNREFLFTIALYRRQLTDPLDSTKCFNSELDELFLDYIDTLEEPFTEQEWQRVFERMPEGTQIYEICKAHVRLQEIMSAVVKWVKEAA